MADAEQREAFRADVPDMRPEDEAEALTLQQWAERAQNAGVDWNDMTWAYGASRDPREQAQRFAILVAEVEHGTDQGAGGRDHQSGVRPSGAGRAATDETAGSGVAPPEGNQGGERTRSGPRAGAERDADADAAERTVAQTPDLTLPDGTRAADALRDADDEVTALKEEIERVTDEIDRDPDAFDESLPDFARARRDNATGDLLGGGSTAAPERTKAPIPATGDIFGGATTRDRVGAAERAKDAQRNGQTGGRVDTGDGGLFDGERPEQTRINEPQRSEPNDAQATDSGIPQGLPTEASPIVDNFVKRFNEFLARAGAKTGFRAAEIARNALPDALRHALDGIGRALGVDVHVIRNLTPDVDRFNGVTFGDKHVFVDETARSPATTVALHEFGHTLEKSHPDLYARLADEVQRQGRLDAYLAKLTKAAGAEGADAASALRELTGDAIGDALTDPAFLQRMAERNPSAFRDVAQRIIEFLNTLLGKVRDLGSNQYLTDVATFRDTLADVLDEFAYVELA